MIYDENTITALEQARIDIAIELRARMRAGETRESAVGEICLALCSAYRECGPSDEPDWELDERTARRWLSELARSLEAA